MTSEESRRRARVDAVVWNLRIDAATAEVVAALRDRGVDSLLLKGPALADWYPVDSPRTYVDGDIWVSPASVGAAEAVLRQLGFDPMQDERGLPGWWVEHASSWRRARDGGVVDLHRRLQGVALDPAATWEIVWSQREPMTVAGVTVERLGEVARALYVTLHAAHHGAKDPRGLPHLRVALTAADEAIWERALELAAQLDALASFSTGLRLVPAGAELAERLGVPDTRSVTTALHAASPPPVALGFEQLAGTSWSRRFAIIARKLFPPPGFVRHWWPPAAKNRRLLLLGYLYRPLWLLLRAPAGYRAWRAARREVKSPR
jgi:Uncharacterised nucleotidyltransferase